MDFGFFTAENLPWTVTHFCEVTILVLPLFPGTYYIWQGLQGGVQTGWRPGLSLVRVGGDGDQTRVCNCTLGSSTVKPTVKDFIHDWGQRGLNSFGYPTSGLNSGVVLFPMWGAIVQYWPNMDFIQHYHYPYSCVVHTAMSKQVKYNLNHIRNSKPSTCHWIKWQLLNFKHAETPAKYSILSFQFDSP